MAGKNNKIILYIDDDENNLKLVKKLLENAGYNFVGASNGIEGIDIAVQTMPDLILMDMNMPGLDGYEAATRLNSMAEFSNIPIVAVTANVLNGDRERSLIAGCKGYIPKPIDIDTFIETINSYVSGRVEKVSSIDEADYLKEYNEKLVEHLERKVRKLSLKLDDALKVSQLKSEFLSTMTHELRTPLNAIINFSELLSSYDEVPSKEKYKECLDHINDNGKLLLHIVTEMLDLASLQAGKVKLDIQLTILNDVILSAQYKYLKVAEARGIKLQLKLDENISIINTDPNMLIKIIECFVDNAIKYTRQGEVIISSKKIDGSSMLIPDTVSAHLSKYNDYCLISVADTGIGIDQDSIDSLFEEFHQLDGGVAREFGGIGLGLAIVKQLVELLGAYIWVESEINKGSVFYLLINCQSER